MDSSKICDNLDSSVDLTEVQSVPCQLCTFVLSNMKQMVDNEESKEDILQRLDEQLCSRWDGDMRTLCQYTIETRGEDLIENIQRGTHPMLLCTYFQVCLDDIYNKCSPIGRDDMRAFLKENVCYQLGTFEDSCYAIMDGDTNRLLHSLVNNKDGQVLCNLFGICSMNTSIIAELSVNDDADKCKRCIRDFTRRKFIAEKLLNNTAEFLHHFCGRLPQEDECTKAVDDSINQLAQFIQSLNPQDICQELKVCNETALQVMQPIAISESDNVLSEQILLFVKTTICSGLGSLSKLCENLVNSEGANALSLIAKDLDPHQVCDVLDICPMKTSDESCPNSCESCTAKVENYQGELAAFLYGMLSEAEDICQYIPQSQDCRNTVSGFQLTIDTIIERFKPKRVCQVLTHCLSSPPECTLENDKCPCCQEHLKFRLNNFRTVIDQITTTSVNLCNEENCHSYFQLTLQQIINQMDKVNSLRLCQRFGICSATMSFRLIPTLLNSMSSASQNLGSYIEQYTENVCSEFGDYKSICEHLITSSQNIYYRNIYIALLKNDPTVIDNSLSEQQADSCDQCKTQVQTSKDFWTKELEVVRNALLQTCEHCSAKDQCQEFYNQRFDNIKSYLDSINPEQVCQKMHLCSVSVQNTCSVCVERLQLRKDAMVQAIGRLTVYFTDLCQQNAGQECQTLTQQMHDLMQISIEEFNANETCTEIGFCTTDDTETDTDFDAYEESLTNEIENSVCSILGPFAALCRNIIQGNTAEIERSPLNYDLKDLMHMESESSESSSSEEELDLDESKGDKCKCCLARVMQRKRHMKFIGDKIFWAHIRACNRCPAKQQCRRHWRMAKERFDERIKRICPMRVCIHLGYCNKSSEAMRPEIQKVETIDRSNSTCILCEYAMSILSNYLKPESTEEEIKESLQKMCSELPSILQNQCYEYIDDYGPAIIAILVQDLDPSTVCHKLNLCTNTMNVDVTHLTKANTTTCGICDYIATYFHFILQRDPSKTSTQHGVSTVCKNLADEQNAKCQTLALLFGPYFEELQLSPGNNFCKELTICQTPMTDLEPAITIKDPEDSIIETDQSTGVFYGDDSVTYHEETTSTTTQNLDVTPQCAICLYVMSYLDAVLKYNKSEEAIEEALEKVCTIIPAKQRTECEQLISTYGPILTDFIANNADPKVVCTFLSMCTDPSTVKSTTVSDDVDDGGLESTSSTTSSIPDSEFYDEEESLETPSSTPVSTTSTKQYAKCIFGMSYWCTSHANAVLCNAVELCELHVWSKKKISHE